MRTKTTLTTLLVLASFFSQTFSTYSQQPIHSTEFGELDNARIDTVIAGEAAPAELAVLLERVFGGDAVEAASVLGSGDTELLFHVADAAEKQVGETLEKEITARRERKSTGPATGPTRPSPVKAPARRSTPRPGRRGFVGVPAPVEWQRLAFGFQPLSLQDEKPVVKMTETDKEIKAEGSDKKSFETKDAKGTRTQKAETRYIKDGKTFGVEIKNTQVIEAVSKPEGKSFRQEISMMWGAEVAACPDAEGVTAGKGSTKVMSKTTFVENGESVSIVNDFDIQAKFKGYVNDQAEFRHYDFEADAYLTASGAENAVRRNLIKEAKVKDGRYGIHFGITGNTIEVSDGTYGGKRTPAKLGKVSARELTPLPDVEGKNIADAIGKMIPTIWNSANEMYKSAEKHWRNYGCVEVRAAVAKTTLEPGDAVVISTETVHLQDSSKVNAELKAEAYEGEITPETQSGRPAATFTFRQTGESNGSLSVESTSKRGIGKGDVDFQLKKEKDEGAAGIWTGTIKAERKQREEREKRSGANLAENGGYLETTTSVQLQLTGRLDRTVEATNAHMAMVSGTQETVDHEYDRYKIDEGYCGPNAVPYKGPKEITRTSTTTVDYNRETRVYLEIGPGGGTVTFSLPEVEGSTVHKYVHQSPCAEHDRANTNEAKDENASTVGGSFSFSIPAIGEQKSIKGSITVQGEDGSITTYIWELSRI